MSLDNRFSIRNDTAIVTGASRGIGKVIAETFAADGANVVVCSRSQSSVDAVAARINGKDNSTDETGDTGKCVAAECDVTDREAVEALIETTAAEFGGVDCLVNNAGASFMAGFDTISPNGWRTILDINLTGTYHCTQAAGKLLADGGGTVLNVSSVAGQRGAPYMSHYAAAKAGIEALTRSLAVEWAERGVRVNCIAPGYIATPGVEEQMGVSADDIDRGEVNRRIGESIEIADVARFLASDAASYIVGETVTVQGVPPSEDLPTG